MDELIVQGEVGSEFMFQLYQEEFKNLMSQILTSSSRLGSLQ